MGKKIIYLDNNATTAIAPEVLEAMMPFFQGAYGNPSSMYSMAAVAGKAITKAREQVAALLGAQPEEIIFTGCGTESDSTAILGSLAAQPQKRHFITSKVEHSAIISLGTHLESKGYRVTYLNVDEKGQLDLNQLEAEISRDTGIVSLMYANNETGTIFPIQKAAELAKSKGVLFHTDAVQAIGKEPINLATLPVDYLAMSGHKLHAPKGIGVLFARKGAPLKPFLIGGHQEYNKRAGTENVPYIVGLGKACELALQHISEEQTEVKILRDYLQAGLLKAIPNSIINGDEANRLSNTLNISFKFVEGEAILLLMDEKGICASSGSACTSGSLEPSHVLRAMDVPFTYSHGSIRFSLSRYTTQSEIDETIQKMPEIINRLRAISPYNSENEDSLSGCCATCTSTCSCG